MGVGCLFSVLICCILIGIAYYRITKSIIDLNIMIDKRGIKKKSDEITKDFSTKMKNIEERSDYNDTSNVPRG